MNTQGFIDDCSLGMDIEFRYNGRDYAVICWPEDGIHVYEQNNLATELILPSPDDVLDKFMIDGAPLRNILSSVIRTL